jgi:hypothetical protein
MGCRRGGSVAAAYAFVGQVSNPRPPRRGAAIHAAAPFASLGDAA